MKVLESKRKDNTVHLKIEEAHAALEKAMEKAFHKLKKHAKIPGFRKGKITRSLFEKYYGSDMLIKEAIPDVVNDAYVAAIDQEDHHVVDYPKNMDIQEYKPGQPIVFSCDVDVLPEVKLGKYKGVKVTKQPDTVDDEALQAHIKTQLQRHAVYEKTENAAQQDDILQASLKASINGEPMAAWTRETVGIRVGVKSFGDEFDVAITGLKAGDSKTFDVTYPDDFHNTDAAGKTVTFDITVKEVQSKQTPELSDELVQKISEHKTIDEYKTKTLDTLSSEAKRSSEDQLRDDILTAIIDDMKVDIQPVLIEREIDSMASEFDQSLRQSGTTLAKYLEIVRQSMADFRAQFKDRAHRKVQADLALNAIAEKEKIEVSDDDLTNEIKDWNLPNMKSDDDIKSYLNRINIEAMKSMVRKRKTMEFLVAEAKISDKK